MLDYRCITHVLWSNERVFNKCDKNTKNDLFYVFTLTMTITF